MSEAGELKEELKTLKAEYQTCQSRYEDDRARLESDVTTLGEKLASLEKTSHMDREEKNKLETELRKVRSYAIYCRSDLFYPSYEDFNVIISSFS